MKRDEYKMTQQVDTTDYKEKYKEALKVASQWHKDGIGDVKTIVECIFPELRESEDEKWRNWLIGHLEGYINQTDDKYAEVCKKAIAWLEKKGENELEKDIYDNGYRMGYDIGKEDALKDLPKWKKATEHKEFAVHVCVMDEDMYPYLDTEVNECEYYIELDNLKNLPKEE